MKFAMISIKRILIITFILTVSSLTGYAQKKDIKYSNQQWIQYYNQLRLSEKWTLLTDVGYRFRDGFSHSSQYIARTGISYDLDPNVSAAVGFANLGFYSADKLSVIEFRSYQEFLLKQKLGAIGATHRFRVEQRYFHPTSQTNVKTENSFNFRIRYRFFLNFPIIKLSSSHPDKKLFLNAGDEIFINAGKKIVYNVFDQNRFLIGSTYQCNDNFSISLTYNHQFVAVNLPETYKQDYVLWLGVKQTIDLTRGK